MKMVTLKWPTENGASTLALRNVQITYSIDETTSALFLFPNFPLSCIKGEASAFAKHKPVLAVQLSTSHFMKAWLLQGTV